MTSVPPHSPPPAAPAATAPLAATRSGRETWSRLASAFLAPLFFVIAFPLLFVGAIHAPTPNDLPILIVGSDSVVSEVTAGLDGSEAFAATQTDIVDEARTSVAERRAMGAIQVDATQEATPAFTVTTYLATAEGKAVAGAVQAAGADVAESFGTTAEVVEVAPLNAQDPLGTNLFYLMTYTSLAAYLVIIVLMQVQPKARLRYRYVAVAGAALAAPLIVFGLSSIFVGDYGASFGTIAALLGVASLYVFTVGSAAILIEQFLGKAATIGIMGFIVLLNFPSSGGPTPASLLPSFWQAVHGFYFGSGAYESFRSIIYFDGAGTSRWLLQLLAWTGGLVLVTIVVHLSRTTRRQRRELEALRVGTPIPSSPDMPAIAAPAVEAEPATNGRQPSTTTEIGATR
ncbi:hypothetical protein ITJ42_15395 [Clavibacter michiganensis subsp. phaseoli]|uniref:ABC transporter permease n=1 Tax=Clavibacter phaseoli TaxID=1734031 RepID=A0A8I0SBK4_9MICO|nr:hypothetical protein [Clavibacter phaseoli]MBF4632603.1 hypothetical protein [Clavibacter phaseoli]